MAPDASTATQILDTAETFVRTRGYNGFSYADIAKVVGVSTASIHYHFPSKTELLRGLVTRYIARVEERLATIAREETGVHERLAAFVAMLRESLGYGALDRLCACDMLATEAGSVPDDVRKSVSDFFLATGLWVERVLDDGRAAGAIDFPGPTPVEAGTFCATIKGATIVARACDDIDLYDRIAAHTLDRFRVRVIS